MKNNPSSICTEREKYFW